MMQKDTSEFRFVDCILTMDACHWCSPSYRGMSSRSELWMTSLVFMIYSLLPAWWVYAFSPVLKEALDVLVEVLIFYPLFVRRARQTGLADIGYVAVAAHFFPLLLSFYHLYEYGFTMSELLGSLPFGIFFLLLIPLYFYGGTFSGRKNELHRAAIAGDRARAERLLAYFPSGLLKRSEKGYTPLGYAHEAGHEELAQWFAGLKEERRAAAEARMEAETAAE